MDFARQPTDGSARPTRLLIVDDHADSLSAMARLLRGAGCDVRSAASVTDALSIAERAAMTDQPIDLLVSDLQLGDGSGLDLARQLQSRFGMRSIAVTGHADPADERESLAAGFEHFLTKPVQLSALLAAIGELQSN